MALKSGVASLLNSRVAGLIDGSPFFNAWKETMEESVAKRFLASFDALVHSFPGLIAQGASRMEDEEARMILAVNLYQECGEGDIRRTHHAIYRRFLETAGMDVSVLPVDSFSLEWKARLSHYLRDCGTGSVLGVLAAGEFLAQPALERIYPALQKLFPAADQEYFTKHLQLETEHVEEILSIIARHSVGEGPEEVVAGFGYGLSVWEDYFRNLAGSLFTGPGSIKNR
jgi:pyrroloquinoline quinone (PQQ) biosynthesis protein C